MPGHDVWLVVYIEDSQGTWVYPLIGPIDAMAGVATAEETGIEFSGDIDLGPTAHSFELTVKVQGSTAPVARARFRIEAISPETEAERSESSLVNGHCSGQPTAAFN